MNTFIIWCHANRDLIIFTAIVLSSFAGYLTHADIHKQEVLDLKREIWDMNNDFIQEHPYMSKPDKEGNTYWITDYSQIGGARP